MRWAMMARILVSGATFGVANCDLGAPPPGPLSFTCRNTSSLVTRPSDPVPATWLRSRLFSFAMRRTSGEERCRSPDPCANGVGANSVFGVTVAERAWGAATAGVDAGGVAAAGAEAFAPEAVPATPEAPEITATTVLTSTVSPAGVLISVSTPATGEGISASTLSVEISNSGSSFSTLSPTFLSHLVMVPSKIDSPIWGIITSVGMWVSP